MLALKPVHISLCFMKIEYSFNACSNHLIGIHIQKKYHFASILIDGKISSWNVSQYFNNLIFEN